MFVISFSHPSPPFFPNFRQLLFVVCFTVFLANCVDYDILFANKFVNHTDSSKVTLPDAFIPMDVCSNRWVWCGHLFFNRMPVVHTKSFLPLHFSFSIRDNAFVIFVLIISGVFWLHRLIKFIYNVCCFWEIRSFYINALKMTMVRETKLALERICLEEYWRYILFECCLL